MTSLIPYTGYAAYLCAVAHFLPKFAPAMAIAALLTLVIVRAERLETT